MLKEKKNNQKVDHFKNNCHFPWGRGGGVEWSKYILTLRKKMIYKPFLLKNYFKCVLTR